MNLSEYPRLGEKVFRRRLSNGLEVVVVNKPFHARRYAFFAVRYESWGSPPWCAGCSAGTPGLPSAPSPPTRPFAGPPAAGRSPQA